MSESVPQESVIIKKDGLKFNFLYLLPLLTLLIGLGLGIVISRYVLPIPSQPQQSFTTSQISRADSPLPISSNLLKNPIVYEWRGSILGKVIAKDEHTLTLEDDNGNKITTTDLLPEGTIFKTVYLKYSKKTDSKPTILTLKDISIGTKLRGEFFVFKNFPNTPVSSQYVIQE